MVVIAMTGVVLLQKSEGGGLGIGGGGGFLSSRGTANVLTRTTAILAAAFFALSLILSILAGMERRPSSILQGAPAPVTQPVPGAPAPAEQPGGVLDRLRQGSPGSPPAGTPSGPQAPQSQ